jgi:hypothetical protein
MLSCGTSMPFENNQRPNAVIGKPKVNYLYLKDGTIHYGRPVVTEITDGVNQEF